MRKDPVGTSSEGNDVNGNARSWLMAGEAYKRVDLAKGNRKSAFRKFVLAERSGVFDSDIGGRGTHDEVVKKPRARNSND